MTRHDYIKAMQSAREIKNCAEKMLKLREEINRPMQDLGAMMKRCEPQSEFERRIFDVIRHGGQIEFAAFNAELLEQYCAKVIPAVASRERVMSICNGGTVAEVPA